MSSVRWMSVCVLMVVGAGAAFTPRLTYVDLVGAKCIDVSLASSDCSKC